MEDFRLPAGKRAIDNPTGAYYDVGIRKAVAGKGRDVALLRTLKGKISLIYVALVALIAVLGASSVLNLIHLDRAVNALMTRNYKSISAAGSMQSALQKQNQACISYIYMDADAGLADFYHYDSVLEGYYQTCAKNVTERGEQAAIDAIADGRRQLREDFTRLAEIKGAQGQAAARAWYDSRIAPCLNGIQDQIQKLISINQTAMFNSKNAVVKSTKQSMYLLLAFAILLVAAGLILSRYFANRFLRPLGELSLGLARVKAGELDVSVQIRTTDEIGRLADEFNEMTARLSAFEKSTMGSLMSERNKSVSIVKSISDPLIVLDSKFRILLVNRASEEYFHMTEAAAVGHHFLETIQNAPIFERIQSTADSDLPYTKEILALGADEPVYFNVLVTKIMEPDGSVSGFILLLQDVTRLKELERVKTEFMDTVSHELKTPLTSIVMGASLLREGGIGALSPEQSEVVGAIVEDGEHLSGIVSELLEISRMEAGKSVYHFAACSIATIAESPGRRFREMAAKRGTELHMEVSANLPPVWADYEIIVFFINNLLSNAFKYTGEHDAISVRAAASGGMVEVSVSDTGEGIPS